MDFANRLKERATKYGPSVMMLTNHLITNPEFLACSGSSREGKHHYGTGGLIEHTWDVVDNCLMMAPKYFVNQAQLFLAALYHDAGKIHDYILTNGQWVTTRHKYRIHHITRSVIMFHEALTILPDTEFAFQNERVITHCILSHHGSRNYGSPVKPQTKMAWILHSCDQISARGTDAED
jgi:3'-5' exoribonuclease